jgi:outer membrane protein TolC
MRAELSILAALVWSLLADDVVHAEAAPAEADTSFDVGRAIAEGPALTASEAAERAAQHAPSLARVEALREAAEATVARVRMELLPRLEASARYAHVDGFPDGRVGGISADSLAAARALVAEVDDPEAQALLSASIEQQGRGSTIAMPRDQVALGARLTWQVSDMFFAGLPTLEAAGESARASEAQAQARALRVRLNARESFYQLARARGNLAVAERAVAQARAQQARVDAGVSAGIRAPADAASAAARVAAAEQTVSVAATAVDVADASLRTMLQDADGPVYGIAEPILVDAVDLELAASDVLIDRARAQRPEVRVLRETLLARQKTLTAQNASGYPHLAVFAGADYSMPNRYVVPPMSKFSPSWEVGAMLSYAPNDTLLAVRRKGESTAQIRALEADLLELLRALDLEVRTARASLSRSSRSIEAAQIAAKAAEAAYLQRTAELGAGEVTLADLYSAENELNLARLRLLDAAIEQQLQKARLAYAVGDEPAR